MKNVNKLIHRAGSGDLGKIFWVGCMLALCAGAGLFAPLANAISPVEEQSPVSQNSTVSDLGKSLKVGDLVFIRVSAKPFLEVSAITGSWTNHVGVVTDISGPEPLIGESTFPYSRTTTLNKFAARSIHGRIAVSRLPINLTPEQIELIQHAVKIRTGIIYDTGFNLHSRRQFCSRFANEVIKEGTGVSVGTVETFRQLLANQPNADLSFWKTWYFGRIPWDRETITPASILKSPKLKSVFDGYVTTTGSPMVKVYKL